MNTGALYVCPLRSFITAFFLPSILTMFTSISHGGPPATIPYSELERELYQQKFITLGLTNIFVIQFNS